jgi:NADH-quinone oxidoreductase subunit G/NADP-reducing hydrogenase subunit HndD
MVSVMPCTAKKQEAERPEMGSEEGAPHVDYVLTTRELGRMLRYQRIPMAALEAQAYDNPMGVGSGEASFQGGGIG